MQLNGKMDYPFGRLPVCENWQPPFYMWEDYYRKLTYQVKG